MHASSPLPVAVLDCMVTTVTCDRPATILKHGDDSPLSSAVDRALAHRLAACGLMDVRERDRIGMIGLSRSGEMRTLIDLTRNHEKSGIYSIDPVVFSKANQFFPVFASCKHFKILGTTSSLFSSEPHAADALYFGLSALDQGDVSHVLVVSYEERTDSTVPTAVEEDGQTPVECEVSALVLTTADGSSQQGPRLGNCRLGPYLGENGRRADLIAGYFRRWSETSPAGTIIATERDCTNLCERSSMAEQDVTWRLTAPGSRGLPAVISALDNSLETSKSRPDDVLHVIPSEKGNIVSISYQPA